MNELLLKNRVNINLLSREFENYFLLFLAKRWVSITSPIHTAWGFPCGSGEVMTNDYRRTKAEKILVVSGPNQGGKTTFARAMGQLHYLAELGLPVPARQALVLHVNGISTHFERQEVQALVENGVRIL